MATRIRTFDTSAIESIARILGDCMTGVQVGLFLGAIRVDDVDGPSQTKWKRIFNALATRQNRDQAGNVVVRFISESMSPVRFTGDSLQYESLRSDLNHTLAFYGLTLRDDGKIARHTEGAATTLAEAEQRANTVRKELDRRHVHPTVLAYCHAEVFQRNNFHAIFEASKSVPDRIRLMTSLTADGAGLFDLVFGSDSPVIRINDLITESDKSEQRGFLNLLKGIHGLYRNPLAHAAKIDRKVSDDELLEAFTTISMVHRRLDTALVSDP
jgi:uncharacterized protein (TIGR02391 family)